MFSLHDIHVPRVPHARFRGVSGMGARGDVIAQMDWSVGEILAALDRLKLADRTLVIFTSDNGPVVDDGYKDDAVAKLGTHTPAGPFRGGKYSNFEGGTRVPWLLRWPSRVKPAVSDALISQVDLFASLAALTGQPAPRGRSGDRYGERPAGAARDVEDGTHRPRAASGRAVAAPGALEVHRPGQGRAHEREHEHGTRQRSATAALRPARGSR